MEWSGVEWSGVDWSVLTSAERGATGVVGLLGKVSGDVLLAPLDDIYIDTLKTNSAVAAR